MILKRLYNNLISWRYSIGFAEYTDDIILNSEYTPSIHWIKGVPKNRWFADPFLLSVSKDEFEVLVENYSYKEKKAEISRLLIDRNSYTLKRIIPLLSLPEHLSFPAYFKSDGMVYIYPENCRSGKLTVYGFDAVTWEQKSTTVVLEQPIADAIIVNLFERPLITGTLYPNDNGKTLFIYPFNLSGHDSQSPQLQVVDFADNTARNAGHYFHIGQHIYRPAQCCNKRYGECLVFQSITSDSKGKLSFREIKRLYSPSRRFNLSFHTFNTLDGILVVDASGYRYGIIGKILEGVRHLFR